MKQNGENIEELQMLVADTDWAVKYTSAAGILSIFILAFLGFYSNRKTNGRLDTLEAALRNRGDQ